MNGKPINYPENSWPDVITLLSDLVVFKQYDFNEFLKKLMQTINKIASVDSCLIYIYDREIKTLTLVASKKPHDGILGSITLKKGEGISGWVVEHKSTVVIEKEAYKDARFKRFKELPEDNYESFLSVPILNESGVIGVVNLQNRLAYPFLSDQIRSIEAVVKIIASAFENIALDRQVGNLRNKLKDRQIVEEAKGIIMKVKQLDESAAYHYLRREAMAKRKSMREIAEAVLLVLK